MYCETVTSSLKQIARSWYVWFYQVPRLPEWLLRRNDMHNMAETLKVSSKTGTFDGETIDIYKTAWRHTGIQPRINRYRGFRRSELPSRETAHQPTLICWGEDDVGLIPAMAEKSIERCDDGQLRMFSNASHWVHNERTEVTEALLSHLADGK